MNDQNKKTQTKLLKKYGPHIKVALLFGTVYVFLLSIQLLGSSFKMFGLGFAEKLIATTSDPLVGLFIGILCTAVVQSSSSTTSIVVALVASGTIPLTNAIPIIMGANMGTTITNTIVSLGHVRRKEEFRRAFAAANLHDFFNLLTVIIIFPLEMSTHFLQKMATTVSGYFFGMGGVKLLSPLKLITEPVIHFIKDLIGNPYIIVAISLVLLFTSLVYIVKIMKSLVMTKMGLILDNYLFKSAGTAFILGMIFTAIVQSSSATTSLIVPIVGAGLITLRQAFPYTMGSNIGTTVTALLAAMATANPAALSLAFAHLFFNIFGVVIFFFFLRKIPVFLAEKFSYIAAHRRPLAFAYVITAFFIIPLLIIFVF